MESWLTREENSSNVGTLVLEKFITFRLRVFCTLNQIKLNFNVQHGQRMLNAHAQKL